MADFKKYLKPIDMVLHCPKCGMQHIDYEEPPPPGIDSWDDPRVRTITPHLDHWTNPPHRSHLCRRSEGGCGHIWRPADVPTNGVAAIYTRGKNDSPFERRL